MEIMAVKATSIGDFFMSNILGFYAPDQNNGYWGNWYPCSFKYGRYTYSSAEQFMMTQKAALFHDYTIFFKILDMDDQSTIKRLGKQVSNYDDTVWSRLRGPMMRRGLRAKFQQNPELVDKLLATGNMVLAECAPRDKIWGIGLAVDDASIQAPQKWKGQNLLGTVLMQVRSDLRCWVAASNGSAEFIDAMGMPANEIWSMPFQAVSKLPRIREAIDIYGEVVRCNLRDVTHYDFYEYNGTMDELEQSMRTNMGGGLPAAWFYEMKQDIYDLVRFNCY